MKVTRTTLKYALAFSVLSRAGVLAEDTFNYRGTDGDSYGPEDWNQVGCDDLATCVSQKRLYWWSL